MGPPFRDLERTGSRIAGNPPSTGPEHHLAPDPADRAASADGDVTVGHGSGKTLFCRLLRYCLGEDRFAPAEQRDRIAGAFPEGRVGAEVMLGGTQWSVVRPIGVGRRHFAIRDADLDQVGIGDDSATGMAQFLEAVVAGVLSNEVAALIPGANLRMRGWWRLPG